MNNRWSQWNGCGAVVGDGASRLTNFELGSHYYGKQALYSISFEILHLTLLITIIQPDTIFLYYFPELPHSCTILTLKANFHPIPECSHIFHFYSGKLDPPPTLYVIHFTLPFCLLFPFSSTVPLVITLYIWSDYTYHKLLPQYPASKLYSFMVYNKTTTTSWHWTT